MYLEIIVQIFVIKGDCYKCDFYKRNCYKCDCYKCNCYKCELLRPGHRPGYKLVVDDVLEVLVIQHWDY
jgi:hypothetical protein